ncbi:hypothetical protein ONZ45_g7751 [Pleurotus djamor]|nr:hypothetical protein ONZ45_g7751 [Pleurotus djamor]
MGRAQRQRRRAQMHLGTTTVVSTTEDQAEASSVTTTSNSPTITETTSEASPTGEQSSTSEESSTGNAESVTSSDSSTSPPPPPPTSSSTSSSTTSETTSDLPTSTSSTVSTTESTSTSTSSSSSDSVTETSTTSTELSTSTTSTSASETTSNTETSSPAPTSSEPTSAPVSLLPTSFTTIEFTTSINGQLTTVTTETPLPTSLWSATPSPNRAMPALIAGVSVGAAVIVLIIIGGIFAYRRHQQKRAVFGFVERLVANQKHQQGRARLLEGEEFNEDDEDLNMTPYRDRDGVHSRGSSLAGMTPMPVHSRGMSSTNAFGVLDPNGRGTPNSSVSAVAGPSGTGNSSPSPSLFRARGNESGSIFHEGGIWPPPGEETRPNMLVFLPHPPPSPPALINTSDSSTPSPPPTAYRPSPLSTSNTPPTFPTDLPPVTLAPSLTALIAASETPLKTSLASSSHVHLPGNDDPSPPSTAGLPPGAAAPRAPSALSVSAPDIDPQEMVLPVLVGSSSTSNPPPAYSQNNSPTMGGHKRMSRTSFGSAGEGSPKLWLERSLHSPKP